MMPTVAMRPSFTPTSARTGGKPEPSTTVPLRITRSYVIRAPLSLSSWHVLAAVDVQRLPADVARRVGREEAAGERHFVALAQPGRRHAVGDGVLRRRPARVVDGRP